MVAQGSGCPVRSCSGGQNSFQEFGLVCAIKIDDSLKLAILLFCISTVSSPVGYLRLSAPNVKGVSGYN